MYGAGAAIGFAPDQVDRMSLWQFAACIDGWNKCHGSETGPDAPTVEEFEAIKRLHGDA